MAVILISAAVIYISIICLPGGRMAALGQLSALGRLFPRLLDRVAREGPTGLIWALFCHMFCNAF